MTIKIELKNSFGRLSQREPFLFADNERFDVEFVSELALKDIMVAFKHGDLERQYRYKNAIKIAIPPAFIKEGELAIEVCLLANGKVQRRFTVEPIVIAKIDTRFEGFPEIDELKKTVEAHGKVLSELGTVSGLFDERLKLVETQIKEIWEHEEE